jgi:hypothetical protein
MIQNPVKNRINIDAAYKISKLLNIPLHPRYTFHWKDISKEQFLGLINLLKLFSDKICIYKNSFNFKILSKSSKESLIEI